MTPEGKLKRECRKIARAYRDQLHPDGLMFHNVEGKGVRGILDTICEHVDGLGIVWCEFKVGDNQPSEQQLERATEIKRAGDRVAFPRSVEEWKRVVGLA